MKNIKYGWLAAVMVALGLGILALVGVPSRIPADEQQARDEAAFRLKQVQAEEKTAPETAAAPTEPKKEETMQPEATPDVFKPEFTTLAFV